MKYLYTKNNKILKSSGLALVSEIVQAPPPEPTPTPWTPAEGDIAMEGWWDANDPATITESSNKVSIWADKNGGAYNLDDQGNSSYQPTTNVASINGLNAIKFENLEYLYNGFYSLSRPNSFAAVVDLTNASWDFIYDCGRMDPNVDDHLAGLDWAFGNFELTAPDYVIAAPGSGKVLVSGVMEFDGNLSEVYVNGTLGDSNTSIGTNDTLSGIMVGAYPPGSGHGGGSIVIGELITYNVNAWFQSEREKMEGYLAWKWGLAGNLPIGHPYKSAAPAI